MRGSWGLGGPYITALHSRIDYFFGPELELYQIRSPSQSFAFMGNRIDYFSSGSSNGLFALLRASSNPFAFMRIRIDYFFEPELGLYQIHTPSQSFAFMGNRIDYFSSGSSSGLFALLRASSNSFAFMRTCIDYYFGPELGLYQIRSPSHSFAFMENRIDYFSSGSSNGLFALLRASSNSFSFMLTHIDHFFFGPELERNRTRETSVAFFLSTTERRLTAERSNQIFLYARSRMGRHLRCRASAHSSSFGTSSRSSYERACWLEVVASVFLCLFGFAWFVLSYSKYRIASTRSTQNKQ